MNDVVNPRLHWNYTKQAIPNIPEEAIPNLDYDRNHILPTLEARKDRALRLYRFIRYRSYIIWSALNSYFEAEVKEPWPTLITGEDTISIKVLLDYDSSEWQWLRSIYGQLNSTVTSDGATFIVLVIPLAYQLAEDYPYIPQELILRYCEENSDFLFRPFASVSRA